MKKTLSLLIASAILLGAYPLKNAISSNDNPTKPKNNIIFAEKNFKLSINATIARNNKAGIKSHKIIDIKNSFNIVLEAIDMDSNKVVAKTNITINANDGFYKVQK